jgi:hypothetical protein
MRPGIAAEQQADIVAGVVALVNPDLLAAAAREVDQVGG